MLLRPFAFFSFLIALATGFAASAQSGDASVTAQIDQNKISVGDRAEVVLEARHNAVLSTLQWPAIPDTFNKLEIVERSKIDTLKNGNDAIYRQRLLVTGFDSGAFTIPRFAFGIVPVAGTSAVIMTDSLRLEVTTVPVDTTKPFKPIKDIVAVKSSWLDYIWWIIGGILLIGLALFTIWYFVKHKKTAMPFFGPKESLEEKAERLLATLEKEKLWENDRVKDYYVRLSEIVRGYIQKRFKVPALEQTTDELLTTAKSHSQLAAHTSALSTILPIADLAKFAKGHPTPQEHIATMDAARQLIRAARPMPVTPPSKKA